MKKTLAGAAAVLALVLGGSAAAGPPAAEVPDAAELVAQGDPAVPTAELVVYAFRVVADDPGEECVSFADPARLPVAAALGEAVPYGSSLYTVHSIGVADGRLVARVAVAQAGCSGRAGLWDFLFVAADGTVHHPVPQGRRGEFTSYEIPVGGWATGLVFFDVPAAAAAGGAVGFRESPFTIAFTDPEPDRPYGLWPVPGGL
ncbi:hypothetical protein ACQPZJ_23955 [Actinoplanes sp. CA-054009]